MFSAEGGFSNRMKAMNVLAQSLTYDEPNEEIREFLERIISSAHEKLNNKIKDEDIDFDIYEIVTSMVNSDKPYLTNYLQEIDPDNLTEDHLISFNNIISSVVSDLNNDFTGI